MKKWLIVAFGLIATVLLAGCRNKEVENQGEKEYLDNSDKSISLTLDELDSLEESLFPVSYTYKTYKKEDGSLVDEGEYIYPSDYRVLLPTDEYFVDRQVSSSEIKNGMIYTMVDGKLWDEVVSILYINDPETLRYSFVTVYWEKETTLYSFKY